MIGRRPILGLIGATLLAGPGNAQARNLRLIGYLSPRSAGMDRVVEPFRKAMRAASLIDGVNIRIEYRYADGRFDRLQQLARELVADKPSVIVTSGGPVTARAVRAASSNVPLVFTSGSDPVADGLVESFNRPGGQTTGVYVFTTLFGPKRLEILREIAPHAQRIGLLTNVSNPIAQMQIDEMNIVAARTGIELVIVSASTPAEIDAAFEELARRQVPALLMAADTFFQLRIDQIVGLAAVHRLPTMYEWPDFTRVGGLISYSPSTDDAFRQAGDYVARVLNGANPGELPIYQPTRFELVVNLKTAAALGLAIPRSILLRADEVIE